MAKFQCSVKFPIFTIVARVRFTNLLVIATFAFFADTRVDRGDHRALYVVTSCCMQGIAVMTV